ncbi:MAG: hypothetical protein ACRD1Z_15775 [Vicinamibacteria bacterium]
MPKAPCRSTSTPAGPLRTGPSPPFWPSAGLPDPPASSRESAACFARPPPTRIPREWFWISDGRSPLRIHGVSLKPHASCRHTHAAIDCALALRPRVGSAEIEAVEVDTYDATLALCDRPRPSTPYEAKCSLQVSLASALLRGDVGLGAFGEESIRDSSLRSLTSKVSARVELGIEARYPGEWPATVRVRLGSGGLLEASTSHPKGDPELPLSEAEIESKFRALAAYGGRQAAAESMLDWIRSLRARRSVRLPRSL